MSYNDKNKKDNMEIDNLNIKSHLNTSLDLSRISVSEDLINRTLAAIKEQPINNKDEVNTSTQELGKKIIPWSRYVRGFAGVAAAIVIVAVGYNIVQQMPIGMKSASDEAKQEYADSTANTTMMATEEAPEAESAAADTSVALEKGKEEIQYTITAETADAANSDGSEALYGAVDSGNGTGSTGATDPADPNSQELEGTSQDLMTTQNFDSMARSSDEMVTYTFRDIFIPSPEQAEYITISDNRNDTQVTLTQADDIKAFYIIMDSHQFSAAGNDSLVNPNYTIEMNSPELGTLYTMLVGSNLTVRYTQGETTSENIYYAVEDIQFKHDLEEFFIEYSE